MRAETKHLLAVLGLIITTIFWGASFILVKMSVETLDVYYFLFLRFTLSFCILAVLFRKRLLSADKRTVGAAFVLSLFMATTYFTQTEGIKITTASNSAMITGLYLVLIPIFSRLGGVQTRILSVVGAVVALIGLYLLTQYSFAGFNAGDAITLVCAVSCAWHIILTGKFTHGHSAIALVVYQFLFLSIFSGVASFFRSSCTTQVPDIAILTIILTAIFCTVFAFVVQTAAQRVIDPSRTGIILAMESVFGAIFAYIIGNETLTTPSLVGAGLMVAGMMISESRPILSIYFKVNER